MTDGRLIKHEIEYIRDADRAGHFEAGAPFRKVADRAVDRRPVIVEGDMRAFENAVALGPSAVWCGLFHPNMLRSRARVFRLSDVGDNWRVRNHHKLNNM